MVLSRKYRKYVWLATISNLRWADHTVLADQLQDGQVNDA